MSKNVGARWAHRHCSEPELLATEPNQVWSWDIAMLKGPAKWTYYSLYVIMDIFSRYDDFGKVHSLA